MYKVVGGENYRQETLQFPACAAALQILPLGTFLRHLDVLVAPEGTEMHTSVPSRLHYGSCCSVQ